MVERAPVPLIPFATRQIGSTTLNTVNARDLYAFLQIKQRFHDWIAKRIQQYGFVEGIDFIRCYFSSSDNPNPPIEYYLTFDMCKELSMVEKTAKGKEARLYFLQCERVAQAASQIPQDMTAWDVIGHLAEAGKQQELRIKALETAQQEQTQHLLTQQAAMLNYLQGVTEANTKADLALKQQQWITLRQYVATSGLTRQLTPSMQQAYGQWLAGYCLEHNIPISREPVADRPYGSENRYHVGTIEATLPGWLRRRDGQAPLIVLTTPEPTA